MTDKRVLKTKQALKLALIEMMKKQSFQKIKVKDLCENANTSKLTFYTHYDDKYALLQDVATDMEQEVMDKFLELQEQTDSGESGLVKHNQDLLKAIIYVEDKYKDMFIAAEREKNYSFYLFFYEVLINSLSDAEKRFRDNVKTKYPIQELTAFLVTGLWGYTYAAFKKKMPPAALKDDLLALTADLTKSNLFLRQ